MATNWQKREPLDIADPEISAERRAEWAAEFLLVVRTAIQALMTVQMTRTDLSPEQKTRRFENLCSDLLRANDAAKLIPRIKPPLYAAYDYLDRNFRSYIAGASRTEPFLLDLALCREDEELPSPRGAWMQFPTREEIETELGPTMVMIDGRNQRERPEWALLPFDDSLALKLLAHVRRSRTPVSISELAKVVRKNHDQTVRRLRELAEEGWVEDASAGDGRVWEATDTLIETARGGDRPPDPTPEPASPPRPYDWEAHHRRTHERAVEGLMNNPDSHTLLRMIRKKGPCGIRDLEDELSHLPRYRTLSLLKRLRTQGWLDVIGKARRAEWVATEKLAAGMPKRSRPQAEGSV